MEKNLAGPGTIGHRGPPERGLVGLPSRSIVLKRCDNNTLYPPHCGSSPSARERHSQWRKLMWLPRPA